MGAVGKLIKFSILGAIIALTANILWFLDLNKRVYNHKPGKCDLVNGPVDGSEDIEFIEKEGIAFITSGIFYMHDRPGVTGKIFLYDWNNVEGKLQTKQLKINGEPAKFRPHGISSYVENGKITLYVVSHTPPEFLHSIEVFDYDKTKQELNYVKTIKHEKFIRPNDLFVVGKDQFVFTNDGTAQTTFTNALEMFLSLRMGSVGFYDGKDVHTLVSADQSPNGIWVDMAKRILFYASPNGEFIKVLKLAKDYKSAQQISKIDLLTSPDNLYMDKNGHLWTAGHPVIKEIANLDACSVSSAKPAPSQALRLEFSKDYSSAKVYEPYANEGFEIACSSVAVHHNGRMLIGTVAGKLLHCEVTEHTI